MERALALARRGLYGAHPNPMVGAVVVKGGRTVGEGFHRRFGGPHAEVEALRRAGRSARGATLYVTLEPCSTWGKTPPCTDAILRAGVGEVIFGANDPNPAHRGRALRLLRAAGVKARGGLLGEKCRALNEAFEKHQRTGLPFVTLKAAQSVDGRIADADGRARWISSRESRIEAHRLRAQADAVLAGVNTVLQDDPRLDVRHVRAWRQPLAVILDSSLRTPPDAKVVRAGRALLATTRRAARRKPAVRAELLILPQDPSGRVSLPALLRELGRRGVGHVLVEGGGTVIGSFLREGLADRLVVFLAPMVIGGERSKASACWPDAWNRGREELGLGLELLRVGRRGPDLVLEYRPRR
ncbi:MAG TPA: bifunctional diaminohydroxyphosphoribosylaminopyrimidine deaminase/5-amino-6-(5-phosphoribosylamino)uracil reductase RibD [Elusimicrobia bacterium]|nr:bifunctional diaminohydroxyphosphoribosylaminopyrimidine deaminase/5-amino-6-(5-phosphoribosylamino)uracil reductase RibD [Elusimicrobiota bacterium]